MRPKIGGHMTVIVGRDLGRLMRFLPLVCLRQGGCVGAFIPAEK